jgi:bisphosphoglycerate-dependent phosphoglycerate mutase
MKGQPESVIERAILQARREADLLYELIINANMVVLENTDQRERESFFLMGYLSAEMNGKFTKERVDVLRRAYSCSSSA